MIRPAIMRLLLALVAGSGCGEDEHRGVDAAVDGASCSDDNCRPYVCDSDSGSCFQLCSEATMCAPGYACQGSVCVGTECTEETREARCGPYACIDGVCATDCAVGPCATGYYCRGDTSTCVPRCTHRGDPLCEGYVCDLTVGECESYCAAGELECAAGYRCGAGDLCSVDTSAPACSSGCGAYACLQPLDRCATHCVEDDDCAAPATCISNACS